MRHAKRTFKLGRNSSHRKALVANLLKNLIRQGRIETTPAKAKELRRHADRMVTLAKKDTLATRRRAIAKLRIRYNKLTPKEQKQAKGGNLDSYNNDRLIMNKLFGELKDKYEERQGGYTRIIRMDKRVGDNADTCLIEFV